MRRRSSLRGSDRFREVRLLRATVSRFPFVSSAFRISAHALPVLNPKARGEKLVCGGGSFLPESTSGLE